MGRAGRLTCAGGRAPHTAAGAGRRSSSPRPPSPARSSHSCLKRPPAASTLTFRAEKPCMPATSEANSPPHHAAGLLGLQCLYMDMSVGSCQWAAGSGQLSASSGHLEVDALQRQPDLGVAVRIVRIDIAADASREQDGLLWDGSDAPTHILRREVSQSVSRQWWEALRGSLEDQ